MVEKTESWKILRIYRISRRMLRKVLIWLERLTIVEVIVMFIDLHWSSLKEISSDSKMLLFNIS